MAAGDAPGDAAAPDPIPSFSKKDFFAGLGDTAAVDVSALADVSFFPCLCFAAGEAAGDSAAAGDASFLACLCLAGDALGLSAAAGDAEASFFECLCLAGDPLGLSAGEGLWAKLRPALNAKTAVR